MSRHEYGQNDREEIYGRDSKKKKKGWREERHLESRKRESVRDYHERDEDRDTNDWD